MRGVFDRQRETIVGRWTELTLQDGGALCETSRDRDRFRSPVAFLVEENLKYLLTALLNDVAAEGSSERLNTIIRVRIARGLDGASAGAFVLPLKEIVRQELRGGAQVDPGELPLLDARIDRMSLIAGDLVLRCRAQIREIRSREERRRTWVLEKVAAKRAAGEHS